jgi:hypothetical protein
MLLLTADLVGVLTSTTDLEQALRLLFGEAWFQDDILYLDGVDPLCGSEQTIRYQRLLDALAEDGGIAILSGEEPCAASIEVLVGLVRQSQ